MAAKLETKVINPIHGKKLELMKAMGQWYGRKICRSPALEEEEWAALLDKIHTKKNPPLQS